MNPARQGAWFALGAYGLWGALPLYLKAVAAAPPGEILMHRVIWSFAFLALLLSLSGRMRSVIEVLKDRRRMLTLVVSSALISLNWLIYIWAVNNDRILSASLGYFITPLANVALGVVLLRERLSRAQALAVGLAALGIGNEILAFGSVPWISLVLALSFALYGLVRKQLSVDPRAGLFIETALLTPFAMLFWLVFASSATVNPLHNPWSLNLLLLAAGPVTAIPLLLFVGAAKRLRYSTLGMFQYLAPSAMLLLAVFVYDEPLPAEKFVTLAFIWSGLLVYSVSGLLPGRPPPGQSDA